MKDDPIVAEVRAIRDKLAAQCGYDVAELFRQLRNREMDPQRTYVRYPPRRTGPDEVTKGTES